LDEINETNDVNKLFDRQLNEDDFADGEFDENNLYEHLILQQKSSQDPDDIVFGFPLNFN